MPEDRLPVAVEVLGKADSWARLAQQPGQCSAADFPRVAAQVLAVELEQVKPVQEGGSGAAAFS